MTQARVSAPLCAWIVLSSCSPADDGPEQAPRYASGHGAWFEEVAAEVGLDFVHRTGHDGQRFLLPESAAGGGALFDMDGDGDLDAYLVQAEGANRLYENKLAEGERGPAVLRFADVSAGSGAANTGYGMGVATADYDGDGDVDLYVTNVGPNVLLRNDGASGSEVSFTDVSAEAGVADDSFGSSAAFFDYDLDGDLDLYVVNYVLWSQEVERDCRNLLGELDYCDPNEYAAPAPDTLYRNDGLGLDGVVRFTDVSDEAGIRSSWGNGLGIVVADYNDDGWPDVFVANDRNRDYLWLNQGNRGSGPRFIEQGVRFGCAVDDDGTAKAGMGVDAADLDGDGDEELLVVNFRDESDSLFRNEGEYFVDATTAYGLKTLSRPFTRFGVGLVDFDNDGLLDLFEATGRVARQLRTHGSDAYAEPNLLFRGTPTAGGDSRFERVVAPGGRVDLPIASARAAVFGDVDNDGRLDVLVVNRDAPAHLLHNVLDRQGAWISFAVLEASGGPALGASLEVEVSGRRLSRQVRSAYSYLSANDPRLHIGLGSAERAESVSVRWLDGSREHFGDFQAGQRIVLRRGRQG